MDQLKPCPFCGKTNTLRVHSLQVGMVREVTVWCSDAEGVGGCSATSGSRPTREQAIEAWNTRGED